LLKIFSFGKIKEIMPEVSLENNKKFLKILIPVLLIVVVAVAVFFVTGGNRVKARDTRRAQDLENLKQALEEYYKKNSKYPYTKAGFPSDSGFCIEYLIDHPSDINFKDLLTNDQFKELPRDPMYSEEKCGGSGYALPDCYCYIYQTGGDDQYFKIWAKAEEGERFISAKNDGGREPAIIEVYSITQGSAGIEYLGKWLETLSPALWVRAQLPIKNASDKEISQYQIMVKEADLLPLVSHGFAESNPIRFADKKGNELFAWKDSNNNWWIKIGKEPIAKDNDWILLYWKLGSSLPTSLTCDPQGKCNSYDEVFETSFLDSYPRNLVAEWLMDEGSGNYLLNTFNPKTPAVYRASALQFDGVDDYIEIGSNEKKSSLALQEKATYELWFYSRENKEASIITQRYDGGNFLGRGISVGNGEISFWSRDSDLNQHKISTPYKLNTWYHIVAVQDGNLLYLYLNGRLMNTFDMKTNIGVGYLGKGEGNRYYSYHTIGKYTDGGYFFNGIIDEVRIYNQPLNAEIIQKHYQGDYSSDAEGSLVMYQSFEEGPSCGNDIKGCLGDDSSKKENNGTMKNFNDTTQYDSKSSPLSGWTTIAPPIWQDSSNSVQWDNQSGTYFKKGSALKFNGDSIITTSLSYNGFTKLTLAAWVKPLLKADFIPILGTAMENTLDCGMTIENSKVCFHDYSTAKTDKSYCSSNDLINLDQWQFIVLTYDSSNIKLYYNGLNVGGAKFLKNGTFQPAVIGRTNNQNNKGFVGFIDQVRIYNTALTLNEIGAQYYHSKCAVSGDNCDLANDPGCRQACGVIVELKK